MATIYVTNRSGHDYSSALRYGTKIIYLTSGYVKKLDINVTYREMILSLKESTKDDYFIPTSTAVLNSIAAAIISRKHGVLNLLLWRDGKYHLRTIDVDNLIGEHS